MAVIRKSAFVATARAIADTEMPPMSRVNLVERLVSVYTKLNSEFKAEEFRTLAMSRKESNAHH